MDRSVRLRARVPHEHRDGDRIELLSFGLDELKGNRAGGAGATDDFIVLHLVAIVAEVAALVSGETDSETVVLRGSIGGIIIERRVGGGVAQATVGAQPHSRSLGLGSKGAAEAGSKGPPRARSLGVVESRVGHLHCGSSRRWDSTKTRVTSCSVT